MEEKDQQPKKHIIRSSAQFSAYTQWLHDCEEFLSELDRTRQYTLLELQELFATRQNTQIENASQTPALLYNLAQQEKRREESYKIEKLQEEIVSIATDNNIIPPRDKEKFLNKLFGIGSDSTNKLYWQYENMQYNKSILSIIYLGKPYDIYMIFTIHNNNRVQRYKLHWYNKKTPAQQPHFLIDDYVDLSINNENFLQSMYNTYNML